MQTDNRSHHDSSDFGRRIFRGAVALIFLGAPLQAPRAGAQEPEAINWQDAVAQYSLLRQTGEAEEAEAMARRAVAIARAEFGPSHANVAQSLNDLGVLLREQGKHAEAVEAHEAALEIRSEADPGSPAIVQTRINLAKDYFALERDAEADSQFTQAYAEMLAGMRTETAHSAALLVYRGRIAERRGDLPGALEFYQGALTTYEQALERSDARLAEVVKLTANALRAQGRAEEAAELEGRYSAGAGGEGRGAGQ